jgi:hypothetical protein
MSRTAYALFHLMYSPDLDDFDDVWGEMRALAQALIAGAY